MPKAATKQRQVSAKEMNLLNWLRDEGSQDVAQALRRVEEEIMYRMKFQDEQVRAAAWKVRALAEKMGLLAILLPLFGEVA